MDMPILRPLPIATKHELPWTRIWNWATSIRQWEVMEDWLYLLPGTNIRVVIPKTFIFDGASIPRPLWGVLSPTGLLLVPGLVHDFGYRYDYLWVRDDNGQYYRYEERAGRRIWDKLFYQIGDDINGMSMLDGMAWGALGLGGWLAWKKNRQRHAPELYPKGYKEPKR